MNDTQTALTYTLKAITEMIAFLLSKMNFKYILLGKFQTDNLEA